MGKACDFLKELKASYSFTPLFIYPPICSGPCVLGTGPLRGGGSGLASGSYRQGKKTKNYYESRNIHKFLREGRVMGRESFLEEDIFEV